MTTQSLVTCSISTEEARRITDEINESIDNVRALLVFMHQSNGWMALGYKSWGNYLNAEFPSKSDNYLRRTIRVGLLEDVVGVPIGTHREGSIRPLLSILSKHPGIDDCNLKEAYAYAIAVYGEPSNRQFETSAMRQYVLAYGNPSPYSTLRRRMEDGDCSIEQAYLVMIEMQNIHLEMDDPLFDTIGYLMARCSDAMLARELASLAEADGELLREIILADGIPTTDGYVPFNLASYYTLRAWRDINSNERRARRIEENRDFYDEKKQRTAELIDELTLYRQGGTDISSVYLKLDLLLALRKE